MLGMLKKKKQKKKTKKKKKQQTTTTGTIIGFRKATPLALILYAFIWEKGKTMDFSETIVVYGVKAGRCS